MGNLSKTYYEDMFEREKEKEKTESKGWIRDFIKKGGTKGMLGALGLGLTSSMGGFDSMFKRYNDALNESRNTEDPGMLDGLISSLGNISPEAQSVLNATLILPLVNNRLQKLTAKNTYKAKSSLEANNYKNYGNFNSLGHRVQRLTALQAAAFSGDYGARLYNDLSNGVYTPGLYKSAYSDTNILNGLYNMAGSATQMVGENLIAPISNLMNGNFGAEAFKNTQHIGDISNSVGHYGSMGLLIGSLIYHSMKSFKKGNSNKRFTQTYNNINVAELISKSTYRKNSTKLIELEAMQLVTPAEALQISILNDINLNTSSLIPLYQHFMSNKKQVDNNKVAHNLKNEFDENLFFERKNESDDDTIYGKIERIKTKKNKAAFLENQLKDLNNSLFATTILPSGFFGGRTYNDFINEKNFLLKYGEHDANMIAEKEISHKYKITTSALNALTTSANTFLEYDTYEDRMLGLTANTHELIRLYVNKSIVGNESNYYNLQDEFDITKKNLLDTYDNNDNIKLQKRDKYTSKYGLLFGTPLRELQKIGQNTNLLFEALFGLKPKENASNNIWQNYKQIIKEIEEEQGYSQKSLIPGMLSKTYKLGKGVINFPLTKDLFTGVKGLYNNISTHGLRDGLYHSLHNLNTMSLPELFSNTHNYLTSDQAIEDGKKIKKKAFNIYSKIMKNIFTDDEHLKSVFGIVNNDVIEEDFNKKMKDFDKFDIEKSKNEYLGKYFPDDIKLIKEELIQQTHYLSDILDGFNFSKSNIVRDNRKWRGNFGEFLSDKKYKSNKVKKILTSISEHYKVNEDNSDINSNFIYFFRNKLANENSLFNRFTNNKFNPFKIRDTESEDFLKQNKHKINELAEAAGVDPNEILDNPEDFNVELDDIRNGIRRINRRNRRNRRGEINTNSRNITNESNHVLININNEIQSSSDLLKIINKTIKVTNKKLMSKIPSKQNDDRRDILLLNINNNISELVAMHKCKLKTLGIKCSGGDRIEDLDSVNIQDKLSVNTRLIQPLTSSTSLNSNSKVNLSKNRNNLNTQNDITGILTGILGGAAISVIGNAITGGTRVLELVRNSVSSIGEIMNSIRGSITRFFGSITDHIPGLRNRIGTQGTTASERRIGTTNGSGTTRMSAENKPWYKSWYETAKNGIKDTYETTKRGAIKAYNFTVDAISKGWNAIKNFASKIVDSVKNVSSKFKRLILSSFEKLSAKIGAPVVQKILEVAGKTIVTRVAAGASVASIVAIVSPAIIPILTAAMIAWTVYDIVSFIVNETGYFGDDTNQNGSINSNSKSNTYSNITNSIKKRYEYSNNSADSDKHSNVTTTTITNGTTVAPIVVNNNKEILAGMVHISKNIETSNNNVISAIKSLENTLSEMLDKIVVQK